MQNQITTTLKDLRKQGACFKGYNKLVRALQGEDFTEADSERKTYINYEHGEEIPLSYILNSSGLDDALWALCASNATNKDCRLLAVAFAKEVQHLMADTRSLKALEVAELYAYGKVTDCDLATARYDASDAAWTATRYTAMSAARSAALAAVRSTARYTAMSAAWAAVSDTARSAEKEKQTEIFRQYLNSKASWQV